MDSMLKRLTGANSAVEKEGGGPLLLPVQYPEQGSLGKKEGHFEIKPNMCASELVDEILNKNNASQAIKKRFTYSIFTFNPKKPNSEVKLEEKANLSLLYKNKKKDFDSKKIMLLFKSPHDDPLPWDVSALMEQPITHIKRTLRTILKEEVIKKDKKLSENVQLLLDLVTDSKNIYEVNLDKLENVNNAVMNAEIRQSLRLMLGLERKNVDTDSQKNDHKEQKQKATTTVIGSTDHTKQGLGKLLTWGLDVFEFSPNDLMMMVVRIVMSGKVQDNVKLQETGDGKKREEVHTLTTNLSEYFKFDQNKVNLKMFDFMTKLKDGYQDNPYHNFFHAVDVFQTVYCLLAQFGGEKYLEPLEIYCLLMATLCHDLDHNGKNNVFHTTTQSPLALTYNDQSVLENHHCSFGWKILLESGLLSFLTPQQFRVFRKLFLSIILHTDMQVHPNFMAAIKAQQGWDGKKDEDREQCCIMLMKSADVSNVTKPWGVQEKWAQRVNQEMFAQGRFEKEHGFSCPAYNDESKTTIPKNSVNFINYVAFEMYQQLSRLLPAATMCCEILAENRDKWMELRAQEEAAEAAKKPT